MVEKEDMCLENSFVISLLKIENKAIKVKYAVIVSHLLTSLF